MKTYITSICIALVMCASAFAADWGSLKGRLVLEGDPGTPKKINVTKDPEFCNKYNLVDETLSVGENNGLQNAFVYLYVRRGKSVAIHPELESVDEEPAILDNKGCRFVPRAMVLRVGRTLEVRNSDAGVGHNTNATFFANPDFNQIVPNDQPLTKVLEKQEVFPSPFACNVHPWMKAYVLVRDNPYMAVTGEDGSFEIKNIPAGTHEFIFWHESVGNLKSINVGGKKTSRKGRAKLKISADEMLDLGEIKVATKTLGL